MNNYAYLLRLVVLLSMTSFAQQTNNTLYKTQILQVFQNLDKTKVAHGILLDFGMEFTNLKAFNGTLTDSTYTSSQTLSDIHKTLMMCRVREVNSGFVTPEEYTTRWFTQRQQGLIVLSGQYFQYSRFSDTAYPSKLNYSNNQFSDKYVKGVWQNPYEVKQLFAMAPAITKYKGLNMNVILPSNLFFSNDSATVQSIQIDFEDGLGYRTVAYNQTISVSYTQANTYIWKYKLNLANGQSLLSHSKVQIEEGIDAVDLGQHYLRTGLSDYYKTTITASEPYLGYYGSATVYIRYAGNNTSITKPLIVAEGLDPGRILLPEQEAGANNIEDFLESIEFIRSQSLLLENEIDTYDIIYVDWNDGVTFLQRNAYVLEEVIKWVNENKTGNVQNVVLGQSMGGLIARYALRDIEVNRNFNHDTRLYVSHDAPHLGANTPISVQMAARHLRNEYVSTPAAFLGGEVVLPIIYDYADGFAQLINLFGGNVTVDPFVTPLQAFSIADVPAAKQMQYNWVTTHYQIDNFIHDTWQMEYSNMGYPQGYTGLPIRNVAIANGSECGVPQVDNGNILSYIKDAGRDTALSNYISVLDGIYGGFLGRLDIVLVSLFPGSSYWKIDFQSKYMTTLNQNKIIYHGSIQYKKKIFWLIPVNVTLFNKDLPQPSGVLPFDIYGGGTETPDADQIPLSGIVSNPFGFIPTASALDIGSSVVTLNNFDYIKPYVGGMPPLAPKNTLFHNFVTHFDQFNPNNNNSPHISFNRRNGNWLQTELDIATLPAITDCSVLCNNTSISGPGLICSSANYSLGDATTTTTWSLVPSNSGSITVNSNTSITVTKASSFIGNAVLIANISSPRCGTAPVSKNLHFGRPSGTANVTGDTDLNPGIGDSALFYVNTNNMNNFSSIIWVVYSGSNPNAPSYFNLTPHSNGTSVTVVANSDTPAGMYTIQARVSNACGFLATDRTFEVYESGPPEIFPREGNKLYTVFPNPSSDIINIKIKDDSIAYEKNVVISGELFDVLGRSKLKVDIQNNSASFSVRPLHPGIYVLKIYLNEQVESHQILVE